MIFSDSWVMRQYSGTYNYIKNSIIKINIIKNVPSSLKFFTNNIPACKHYDAWFKAFCSEAIFMFPISSYTKIQIRIVTSDMSTNFGFELDIIPETKTY